MNECFILIPTLNPNIELLDNFLVDLQKKFKYILLFDDGCKEEYQPFFAKWEKKNIVILHHYINLGKGRALKDAFNYILVNYPEIKGVICADSDGQHSIKDIEKCYKEVIKHPHDLILGCRNFDDESVPTKNKMGNKITRSVFKIFVGLSITDTQTGLRGLSREVMCKYLDTKGERFEYENNQLIDSIEKDIHITEYPIETIYNNIGKSESHFNPFKDSIAIYKTFGKYILASTASFVLDITLFTVFNLFIPTILICTIIARVISSVFNYFLNAKAVFKKQTKASMFKYFILVIVQMFASGLLTTLFVDMLGINATLVKIVVDIVIFMVNFFIQKHFIFGGKNEK